MPKRKMTPRFSIIVPVYNVESYLDDCLASVIHQTYDDFECICINDGSTDGSLTKINEYAGKDSRIRVLSQKNSGVSSARNAGLDAAKGEWAIFLDGDDVLNINLLTVVANAIDSHGEIPLVKYGYRSFCDAKLSLTEKPKLDWAIVDCCSRINRTDCNSHFASFAYRIRDLKGLRFAAYRRGEDHLFLIRHMIDNVNKYLKCELGFYGYRVRAGSEMNSQLKADSLYDEMRHFVNVLDVIDNGRKLLLADECGIEVNLLYAFPCRILLCEKERQAELYRYFRSTLLSLLKSRRVSNLAKFIALFNMLLPFQFTSRLLAKIGLVTSKFVAKAKISIGDSE